MAYKIESIKYHHLSLGSICNILISSGVDCFSDELVLLDQPDGQHADHIDAVFDVLSQRRDVKGVQEDSKQQTNDDISNDSQDFDCS